MSERWLERRSRKAAAPSGRPIVSAALSRGDSGGLGLFGDEMAKLPPHVEQGRDIDQAVIASREMGSDARPAPVVGAGDEFCPERVQRNAPRPSDGPHPLRPRKSAAFKRWPVTRIRALTNAEASAPAGLTQKIADGRRDGVRIAEPG